MGEILKGYEVNPATWFYLSLLLIIAVYFRFGRLWSLRNLDLALLLSMSPCLLLVQDGPMIGYSALFVVTGLILLRIFCDSLFTRRPLLEPNLNVQGMAFLATSAFAFLMTIAMTQSPPPETLETVRRGESLLNRTELPKTEDVAAANNADGKSALKGEPQPGPASSVLAAAGGALSKRVGPAADSPQQTKTTIEQRAARMMAILAHSSVLIALFFIGRWLFGDGKIGLSMATLYLLLPCTAYDVHKVIHVLPAALILWAVLAYRRPMVAGSLMGFACGALFFPVFLLPLWTAFYGKRNALRFGGAFAVVAVLMLVCLALTSADMQSFVSQIRGSIDWGVLKLTEGETAGFWVADAHHPMYAIPVFAAFLVVVAILTIWPRQKNLEHLIAHSTAIIVGTQFWYPQKGGVYLLWYLPLLLLVVFRPSLAHLTPPQPADATPDSKAAPEEQPLVPAGSAAGNGNRLYR